MLEYITPHIITRGIYPLAAAAIRRRTWAPIDGRGVNYQ